MQYSSVFGLARPPLVLVKQNRPRPPAFGKVECRQMTVEEWVARTGVQPKWAGA